MLEFAGCIRCGVIILAQFLQRVDAIPVTVIEIMKTTPPPFPSQYGAILVEVQVHVASHQHASPGYSIYSHATQQPGYVRSHAQSDIKG